MKKIFLILMLALSIVSCNNCGNKPEVLEVMTPELNVENIISMDKEYMFLHYGGDYRWFETNIVLKDYLNSEECDGTIAGLANVFQVLEEKDNGFDVFCIFATHTKDTTAYNTQHGFYIEDFPLENDTIKLTFADAFQKIQEVNAPKPASKNCVLRKPIGPKVCNPQYVFGNTKAQLWVDAITGDVRTSNPAFPEEKGFKMPLGEWP